MTPVAEGFTVAAMTDLTPERIRAALVLAGGNVSQAAKTLGVSRQTTHKWMKRYGIERRVTVTPQTAA